MTTETKILTDEFISALWDEIHASFSRETFRMSHHDFARHIEAAVLQSYESQLLRLLVDIRFAAGDDGKRMQPELVEHIAALRKDAERYRWLKANIQDDYTLPGGYYIPDEDTGTWDKTVDTAMEQKP
ncbi:hypothetical protein ACMHYJ_14255 [Castellaniella hirudinis]|uniref:hypothetical protein n=1 Tax=Castellaniella hirudinis TaxID=1144617 RepID=UPI0039C2DF35